MSNSEKNWSITIKNDDGKSRINTTLISSLVKKYINSSNIQYAFLATYDGMDVAVLANLLLDVPGGNQLIRENRFDAYYGAKAELQGIDKTHLAEKLQSNLHSVLVEGAFHPKIYLFVYREGEEDKIVLIIGSKNITSAKFLDNYVLLMGRKTNGVDNANGKQLKSIISFADLTNNKYLKDLDTFKFSSVNQEDACEVSFCKPDKKVFQDIFNNKNNNMEFPVLVVSPFVSLDEIPSDCYVKLLSRKEELNKTKYHGTNIDLYDFNSGYTYLEKDIVELSNFIKDEDSKYNGSTSVPPLHAKLYCYYDGIKTTMYIGSANCTYNAFSDKNVEVLVKTVFQGRDMYDNINSSIFLNNPYCSGHEMSDEPGNAGNNKQPDYNIFKILKEDLKIEEIKFENNKWVYRYKDLEKLQIKLQQHKIKIKKVIPGFDIKDGEVTAVKVEKPTKYGTVYLEYTDKLDEDCIKYSFNIDQCIEVEDGMVSSWLDVYNAAVSMRIQEDLKEMKNKILLSKGRKIFGRIAAREGTKAVYESIVSDGLYEMIKNAAILCSGNKEQAIELIKQKLAQIVLELTEDEKNLVKTVCGGDKSGSFN